MNKIVVVGSLNMDMVVRSPRLPIGGETLMGTDFHQINGGKGANQAVAMARLGAQVQMIGRVGADSFGIKLTTALKNDGIDVSRVESLENISTGVALITVQDSGENAIIVVPGANGCLMPSDLDPSTTDLLNAKLVVAQLEVPLQTIEKLMTMAKANGSYTVLNPAPAQELSHELLKQVDLLTPNETELALLSGLPTGNLDEVKVAADCLLKKGVKEIVVTLGSEGAIYLNQEGTVILQSAFKVEAVDTTAAGDSFTAGLAVALSEGKSMAAAMTFASCVGALTVQKIGAQSSLPTREEVSLFGNSQSISV